MNDQNTQFVFALLGAASRLERRFNGKLASVKGISFTEYRLLDQLAGFHNSAATRVELARAVHLTPSAVTRALKPLEKIGLVNTEKGARDARQSVASLSSAGKQLLSDANSLVNDEIAGLTLEPEASAELTGILARLAGD